MKRQAFEKPTESDRKAGPFDYLLSRAMLKEQSEMNQNLLSDEIVDDTRIDLVKVMNRF